MPEAMFFGVLLCNTVLASNAKGARVTPGVSDVPRRAFGPVGGTPDSSESESLKWETALELKYAHVGEIERRRRPRSGALKW